MSTNPEMAAWVERMKDIKLRLSRPANLSPQDRTRLKAELGQIENLTGLHSKA
jgi:hypothetical protein